MNLRLLGKPTAHQPHHRFVTQPRTQIHTHICLTFPYSIRFLSFGKRNTLHTSNSNGIMLYPTAPTDTWDAQPVTTRFPCSKRRITQRYRPSERQIHRRRRNIQLSPSQRPIHQFPPASKYKSNRIHLQFTFFIQLFWLIIIY